MSSIREQYQNISRDEALRLCRELETQFLDKKSKNISGKSLQKHGVAFANADGGTLILGIRDDSDEPDPEKRWDGAVDPEEYNQHLQSLFNLNPTLPFRYDFVSCSELGGIILRIYIDKSQHVCQTGDGSVYQRVGAQSLPIKENHRITELSFAKGGVSYENTKIDSLKAEDVAESPVLVDFCKSLPAEADPLAYCVNEGLVDRNDWTPLAAGVLLYTENPQSSFPTRCEVRIVFYDTREDQPEREHLKINETVSGNLYDLIHRSVNRISEIMSGIRILTTSGLAKVKYPPEAIWEILVNAVIHRDYSISDDVIVKIFQNRIEVHSPGKLPGFVTVNNILDVRYSRNPKIVKNLHRYPEPPNKDLGEGLNTAFQKMKDFRLHPPEIKEEGNYLVVTIGHTPLASPEDAVLEYLKKYTEITNSAAREITGIKSENQMKEVFYRLRDQGLLERVPGKHGNKSAWRMVVEE